MSNKHITTKARRATSDFSSFNFSSNDRLLFDSCSVHFLFLHKWFNRGHHFTS